MQNTTWVVLGYIAAMIMLLIWAFIYLRMKGYGYDGYKGR